MFEVAFGSYVNYLVFGVDLAILLLRDLDFFRLGGRFFFLIGDALCFLLGGMAFLLLAGSL